MYTILSHYFDLTGQVCIWLVELHVGHKALTYPRFIYKFSCRQIISSFGLIVVVFAVLVVFNFSL